MNLTTQSHRQKLITNRTMESKPNYDLYGILKPVILTALIWLSLVGIRSMQTKPEPPPTPITAMAVYQLDSALTAQQTQAPANIQCLLRGCPDSAQIYGQILSETGGFTSRAWRHGNNLFGFHDGRNYLTFASWRECFDWYMEGWYGGKLRGESFCAFLRRMRFGYRDANGVQVVDYCR